MSDNGPRCMVVFCQNKGKLRGVSYFQLRENRYRSWLEALGIDPAKNKYSYFNRICSAHFNEEDITFTTRGRICLRDGAIPRINLGPNAKRRKCFLAQRRAQTTIENHTEVGFSLGKTFTTENIFVKREVDDFDTRETGNEVDGDLEQKSTIKREEEDSLETQTELNFFLKEDLFPVEEGITVKSELQDFDDKKYANEVDRDLELKSTIKSEEEDFINSQHLIGVEEVNIKSEDDVDQLDNRLKDHKSKDQITIHKCPDCPYQSKCKGHMIQHSVRHKKPDEIVWHHCTVCPYKTKHKGYLKVHAISHIETRQLEIVKCAYCDYKTSRKPNLTRHLVVHCGEDIPWMHCPEPNCSYKTHTVMQLRRHSSVHSNDQFFKCTQCPYQAKRLEYLKNHLVIHESSDKWHACPQCPFKTIRKCSLTQHALTHANIVSRNTLLPTTWTISNGCSARPVHLKLCKDTTSSNSVPIR